MNGFIVRLKKIALVFLLLSSSIVTLVSADWGMVPVMPGVSVYEPGQKAIIAWNGHEQILILTADVTSTVNTTVLQILPLPSNPTKIEEASLESFYVVQELILHHAPPPPPNGYYVNETDQVEVVFHEQIGMHDITVVEAYNVSEFAEWMGEFLLMNGISQQVSLEDFDLVIGDYMLRGFHFYVLDLLELSSDERSVEPILYKFDTSFLYYPLLITSPIGGEGKIILFLITEDVIESGYYPLRKAQYYGPDILEPIQFELSKEELSLIDPNIGELFDDKAWLTALTYEGPLDKLTEDVVITPKESLPSVYISPPEIYGGFAINVNIKDLEASDRLVSVELRLEFDTTMLFLTEVIEGDFMKGFAPHGTFFFVVVEDNCVLVGIQISHYPETGNFTGPFPEGSGTFAAFCFEVLPLVEYSTIHLTSHLNGLIGDIPHTDEDGHIRSIWNRADVNFDGKVNILDVSVSAHAFGSCPGQFRWNTNVDLAMNLVINIMDIVLIAKNFGETLED